MNTISQSEPHWSDKTKFTIAPSIAADDNTPKVGDTEEGRGFSAFGDDGLNFGDFIDIINPLHHIPVIGAVYRKMTGDALGSASKVLGSSLFLGPLGTISALANILVNEATGKDVTEHAIAFFENTDADQHKAASISTKSIPFNAATTSTNISFSSRELTQNTNSDKPINPVTAWAMAETSYRQSASDQISTADNTTYEHPHMYKNIFSDTKTIVVTEWARTETSFRKAAFEAAPSSKETTKPLTTQATAKNSLNTLTAVNNNLSANKNLSIAHEPPKLKIHSHHTTKNVADVYARQQSMTIRRAILATKNLPASPAPGAIATEGGWFSDTMLSALEKRNDGGKPVQ